nr:pilus assembly protein TadG-related protein [Arthrobacter sp. ISL-30]
MTIRQIDAKGQAASSEEGQMMVMIVGFVLLSLLLATVIMAVSAVYIEHKKLLSLADGAAAAAADSYTLGAVEAGLGSPTAVLTAERVRNETQSYLNRNAAFARFDGLAVAPGTGTPDSSTAEVVLSAVVQPPIVNFLLPEGVLIEASSSARSRLTR